MNFGFQNISAFWGLFGILIPITIHLLSRSKGSTIWVGNIRWIEETEQTKSRNIRLNEYALLLLRSLIIAMLIFIWADPITDKKSSSPSRKLALIDPLLLEVPEIELLLDSIESKDLEIRYMNENDLSFEAPDTVAANNLFTLLELLEEMQIYSEVTTYSQGYMRDFEGKLPEYSFRHKLVIFPSPEVNELSLVERRISEDSVVLISQFVDGNNLRTQKKMIKDLSRDNKLAKTSACIIAQKGFDKPVAEWERIFKAFSLQPEINFEFLGVYEPGEELPEQSDSVSLVVLIGSDLEITGFHNSKMLIYNPEKFRNYGDKFLSKIGFREYFVLKEVTPSKIYEEELLREIYNLIFESEISDQIMRETDLRQFSQTLNNKKAYPETMIVKSDFTYPFWLSLIILLIAERVVSRQRKQ